MTHRAVRVRSRSCSGRSCCRTSDPQAIVGFSLLEVVNYLEHYGLLRSRREDGRYERTAPEHSWNSNNMASNVLLYHLQRHSDHHANPIRRYQALRHVDEAPQLPTGYAGMIVLADDPAAVATGDGPAAAGSLRGRRDPREHRPAPARVACWQSLRMGLRRVSRYRCPACGYVYDEQAGPPPRGLPGGDPVERGARRLGLSGLRRARQGRLRAGRTGSAHLSRPFDIPPGM